MSTARRHLLLGWVAALILTMPACDDGEQHYADAVRLTFGRTGLGAREFSYPRAAVLGGGNQLFVVDKSARIQRFGPDGTYELEWRMPAWEAGKPTGLGVGPDGRIYVADTHYSRVVVYEPDGTLVGMFGQRGEGPGQFLLPTDVAVAADGGVYVGEYSGNDRINKFSPTWQYEFSFGGRDAGEAMLQRPQALLLAADGTLWVADACNHRIGHFTAAGEWLGAFGRSGSAPGELRFPYGLDFLSDGTLLVAEYGNDRLQRFDTTGRSLGIWGRAGRKPGELAYPWAVAVGPDDTVFVIDSGNNRVQVVDAHKAGMLR
jgi:DNA-binding beta-propeller fold protein YncE